MEVVFDGKSAHKLNSVNEAKVPSFSEIFKTSSGSRLVEATLSAAKRPNPASARVTDLVIKSTRF